jgi:hypothetical protein
MLSMAQSPAEDGEAKTERAVARFAPHRFPLRPSSALTRD